MIESIFISAISILPIDNDLVNAVKNRKINVVLIGIDDEEAPEFGAKSILDESNKCDVISIVVPNISKEFK